MAIAALVMVFAVFIVTLLSCASDIGSLRIPNVHSLIILGCFIPAWLAVPAAFAPLWQHLAALVIMFGITYVMFCAGLMGGGDSKLGTALGLWVGLKGLLLFVVCMSLTGGVLAAATLVLRKKKLFGNPKPGGWIEQAQTGQNAVPYGVAISLGSWIAFLHTGILHQQLSEVFKIIH